MSHVQINRILQRGLFTDQLLAYVTPKMPSTVLLGDSEAPTAGGWSGDQAGSGTFKPYVSLHTGPATKNLQEPIRGKDGSWRLSYSIKGAGANRQQADFALDNARAVFSVLATQTFACGVGGAVWKVLKSDYVRLGEITLNNATDPPTYEGTDELEIWLDLGP